MSEQQRRPILPTPVKRPQPPAVSLPVEADPDDIGVMPDLGIDPAAEEESILRLGTPYPPAGSVEAAEAPFEAVDMETGEILTSGPAAPSVPSTVMYPPPADLPSTPPSGSVEARAQKAGLGAVVPSPSQPNTADSRSAGRPATGLAYQGKKADIPARPSQVRARASRISTWMEGYSPFARDFHDLAEINNEVAMVSRAMMEVERIYGEFSSYERDLATRYEQERNRAMVEVTGSSEKMRAAYAEILVEELRQELDEVRLEVQRTERAQRMLARHLDALTVIANNVRAGVRLI